MRNLSWGRREPIAAFVAELQEVKGTAMHVSKTSEETNQVCKTPGLPHMAVLNSKEAQHNRNLRANSTLCTKSSLE